MATAVSGGFRRVGGRPLLRLAISAQAPIRVRAVRWSGGRKFPNGVQGQSSGRGSWGRSPQKLKPFLYHHHHHHHDAKRSAVASRRCDLPPKRSVHSQLESISHRYSRVPADLTDPCGERSASSAPPVGWWPGAVLSFAAGLEDLVCWEHHRRVWQRDRTVQAFVCGRYEAARRPVRRKTSSLVMWSYYLMWRIRRRHINLLRQIAL